LTHIPALQNLIQQAVRILGGKDYTPQQVESSLKYVFGAGTSQLIQDGTYYIVESGGIIVGAGGWSRRKTLSGDDQAKSGEDNLLDPATETARIRAFYVHPNWARRGIGSQLMEACETAAKAAGFQWLELMATLTGEPLYARCGFEVLERTQIEMPDGVMLPVTKMTKDLGHGKG
jgi:GNAT superfamily N-acetyltransferase